MSTFSTVVRKLFSTVGACRTKRDKKSQIKNSNHTWIRVITPRQANKETDGELFKHVNQTVKAQKHQKKMASSNKNTLPAKTTLNSSGVGTGVDGSNLGDSIDVLGARIR